LADLSANYEKTGLENRPRLTMGLQSVVECASSLDQTLPFVGIPKLLGRLQQLRKGQFRQLGLSR
jgi:hypothetical protein